MNFNLLSIFAYTSTLPSKKDDRIIGGRDAKRHQFPYIVALYYREMLRCGGTIISHTWIVSAAHCFFGKKYEWGWIAIAGLLNKGESHPDQQSRVVVRTVIHEQYILDAENSIIDNDIALVKLIDSLHFTKAVQPAKLPRPDEEFYGTAWVSGWGVIKYRKGKPVTLQYLQMELITNEECKHIRTTYEISPPFKILDTIMCTTLRTGSNTACYGDSGGPLEQNGVLIGIVSFGDRTCGTDAAKITNGFTRVSEYIDFIESQVTDLEKKLR